MITPRQQLHAHYPGFSIIAGPYKIEQPFLEHLAKKQKQQADDALAARRRMDPQALLVQVGRVAYVITQKALAKVRKDELVASGGFQVKAGRGGWE